MRQRGLRSIRLDRGSEFANAKFYRRADASKIHLSMSSTSNCYDNAAAEKFFAPVKLEAISKNIFASRQQARMVLGVATLRFGIMLPHPA